MFARLTDKIDDARDAGRGLKRSAENQEEAATRYFIKNHILASDFWLRLN
jgi:hypothetical protein